MSQTLDELRKLEIPGVVTFDAGRGDLPRLLVHSDLAKAEIYLQGAHLTHYQPAGAAPVLFVSQSSLFAPGKPIRGGVPVCFPWFAARAGHPKSPAHGFARTKTWTVESVEGGQTENVTVVFRLGSDDETRSHWPHEFVARLKLVIGQALTMAFSVENRSGEAFTFEEALHTYFAVSDARQVAVAGLANATFIDKTDNLTRKQVPGELIKFTAETDSVFPGTTATCVLQDPGAHRSIIVEKAESATTVVWNPWIAKAAAMADFGDDEWPQMVCIETANAGDDAVTIAPGVRHEMTAIIRLA